MRSTRTSLFFLFCLVGVVCLAGPSECFGWYQLNNDFDNDGKSDLAVWRPSNGTWYAIPSTGTCANIPQMTGFGAGCSIQWGLPGDTPVTGDYDGDNKTDYVVFRPSYPYPYWYLRYSSCNCWLPVQWGLPGDFISKGDFTGDNKTDLIIYRPTERKYYIRDSTTQATHIRNASAILAGEVSRDILAGGFYYQNSYPEYDAPVLMIRYLTGGRQDVVWRIGESVVSRSNYQFVWTSVSHTDVPLSGNYLGNSYGLNDWVLWRPSDQHWRAQRNTLGGEGGAPLSSDVQWGQSGDIPVSGDYDGDGIFDPCVYRPSGPWEGYWFVLPSTNTCPPGMTSLYPYAGCTRQWGLNGDVPLGHGLK